MTRFTVVWVEDALDQLTEMWLRAGPDRNAVTEASNQVDQVLAVDPESKGASLRKGLRILDIPPLRVLYTVADADRLVRVVKVEWFHPAAFNGRANGAPGPAGTGT